MPVPPRKTSPRGKNTYRDSIIRIANTHRAGRLRNDRVFKHSAT